MEFRARPHLEVALQVKQIVVEGEPAAAVVDRVRGVGVNEAARRDRLFRLGALYHLGGDDVGEEDVGIDEDTGGEADRAADNATSQDGDDPFQHGRPPSRLSAETFPCATG